MNKQVEQEAKRLIGVFLIMVWDDEVCDWVENKKATKNYALKCLDEIIEVLNENDSGSWNAGHEAYQNSITFQEEVKNYIETNY